jgi:transposase
MPAKRYIVGLTQDERLELLGLINKGKASARILTRARILLKADEGWTDKEIVEALNTSVPTVERIRRRFVEGNLEKALHDDPRPGGKCKLDGRAEAQLIALACSKAPEGHTVWNMRLLADKLVELSVVESVSHEAVRQCMKKNDLKPWQHKQWCIPEPGAEFVACMEDVLDVYEMPYNPAYPTVCFDEASKQLIGETRVPCAPKPGQVARYDYEYERNGTSNLFMFFEPLRAWRHVKITDHRTGNDWAHAMKDLVDVHFPDAERVRVVMDNLNTHTIAALYNTFEPAEARRIARKLEIHYTPKHASWLNMAEIEFSVLGRECLNRRIPDVETLQREVAALEAERNAKQSTVRWRFATDDARIKLRRLYPSFSN